MSLLNHFIISNFVLCTPETTTQSTTAVTTPMKTTMSKLISAQQQPTGDLATEPGTNSAAITAEDTTSSYLIRTNDQTPLSKQTTISDAVASIAKVENSMISGKS